MILKTTVANKRNVKGRSSPVFGIGWQSFRVHCVLGVKSSGKLCDSDRRIIGRVGLSCELWRVRHQSEAVDRLIDHQLPFLVIIVRHPFSGLGNIAKFDSLLWYSQSVFGKNLGAVELFWKFGTVRGGRGSGNFQNNSRHVWCAFSAFIFNGISFTFLG